MTSTFRSGRGGLACIALCLLAACSTLPRNGGRDQLDALLAGRTPPLQSGSSGSTDLRAALSGPLDPEAAVALAWRESPRIRLLLAELGLASADLFESGRLRNLTLSAGRMGGSDGTTTLGIGLLLGDLVTLPARSRIGRQRWQAALAQTAQALVDEAAATRTDWIRHVAAVQVAELREAVAEAAALSAELAARFHAAGNISALQLAREQAAASLARTEAARARSERFATRMALAERLGLAGRSNAWRTPARLPLPPLADPDLDTVLSQAGQQRHDLAAANALLAADQSAASLARSLAWLGGIEFGFEREREDGERRSGPHLSLQLPLFQQGQAQRTRATALRDMARERVALLQLQLQREVRSGLERLATQRAIIATFRDALIPQREAIVAREQERYNFMLIGVFELIQARQQEYDAYQAYIEAIRDYWLHRVELARVAGGVLPGDDTPSGEAPALDDLLGPPGDHDPHHHH
ncbi:TolC family protein [Pseudofulvimonas gallinarii]|uniref:Cobalt-zinc-cadmium efflux system outer membrane protein n=1 Tax=Pseudofulvimonas gallinarii TaxID=634155 RepID=A0A4R3LI70_9GAMM|nr:TolC family protein [Pseudofulvimonas gallinarii]TCS98164.1 cobalt-zinc-cadmium efflux system outer membrane protein [Pseudofulvimonas gallinarii]